MNMKILFLIAALAAAPAQAAAAPAAARTLAEDVADIATRVCAPVESGRLRWDPADLAAEEKLFRSLGLTSGIPAGVLDGFGSNAASTFNQSVLASRPNGASHVLLAVGGQTPGCRVSVSGAPGVVTAQQVAAALEQDAYGWTPAPELGRKAGAVERTAFVRKTGDGRTLLLDLVFVTVDEGSFRLMAMVMHPPRGLKLPPGF